MSDKYSDTPLLSIITLTYNNQNYLPETINSIFAQNYPNFELIISDDGSADFDVNYWQTYICEHYPQFDGRRVIRKNDVNLGTVCHVNVAIKYSSGKYIKLLPSGDLFYCSTSAAQLVEKMEQNKWQIANSSSIIYDEELINPKGYYPKKKTMLKMGSMTAAKQFHFLTGYNAVGGIGTIFTRDLYDTLGGFDETYRLTEDWPTWLKLTRNGVKIESIDFISVKYRLGGVSGAGAKNPVLLNDFILLMEREIFAYRDLFNNRQWRDLQVQYKKALHWNGFSAIQKLGFLARHISYFLRHRLIR